MASIQHNGHTWLVSEIDDGSYSVVCADPAIDDEGIDRSDWPTAADVSDWVGVAVRYYDVGESAEGVEAIYRKRT